MAFTRIRGAGIHTTSNINTKSINATGIITALSFVGDGSGLTGVASTDNIVTGTAATFNTYPVDINAGMTVAGVSSFSGALSGTTANFSGNVTVGGVLTYEDVKNIDSVGLGTFREGIFIPDSKKIKIGNTASTPDIEIYHSPSNAFIDNHTGGLFIRGNVTSDVGGNVAIQAKVNENSITCHDDGAVDLYYNGTKQFETNFKGKQVGTGVTIETKGQATVVGVVTFGSSSTTINGNTDTVNVGTALTLGHTQGLQFHTQNLHSDGFEVNQINATGVITATSFSGGGAGGEVYGFTGIGNSLSLTTTNNGADNIDNATYVAFEESFIGPSGISFSINTSGNLIMTV